MQRVVRWGALVALLALAGVIVAACGSSSSGAADAADLENTNWKLDTLGDADAVADAPPLMSFAADGRLWGSTGCNHFDGTWAVDEDDNLTLDAGRMTLIGCIGPVGEQETAFLQALTDTRSATVEDDDLELRDESDDTLATFSKLDFAELVGPTWRVTAYNNGADAVVSDIDGSELTAVFASDGTLSGNAGCNTFTTSYEAEGDALTIGEIASTMMACDQSLMDQESQFLAALGQAATFELGFSTLTLHAADGATLVLFQSAE